MKRFNAVKPCEGNIIGRPTALHGEGDLIIARLSPQGYHEVGRTPLIKPTSTPGNRRELGAVGRQLPVRIALLAQRLGIGVAGQDDAPAAGRSRPAKHLAMMRREVGRLSVVGGEVIKVGHSMLYVPLIISTNRMTKFLLAFFG